MIINLKIFKKIPFPAVYRNKKREKNQADHLIKDYFTAGRRTHRRPKHAQWNRLYAVTAYNKVPKKIEKFKVKTGLQIATIWKKCRINQTNY